ncbi:hypothetical protein PQX77_014363, partial [Marasmius sp. AFHP31]
EVEEDESSGTGESSEAPQFVIDDEEDSEEDGSSPNETQPPQTPKQKEKKKLPSLGERLFNAVIDLMFCCGFTLPTKIQKDHHKINYVIWEKGIGSTTDSGPSQQYDNNKTEVLRLLLVLLSRQIYISASSLFTTPSLYTLHFVQKLSRRDVLTVLCSLLNTAMNSTSIPATIGNMAGRLPYNHLVFKGEDPRANLVSMCFQVLVVLLDFQSGSARDIIVGSDDQQSSTPSARTNTFRYFLMKLHRTPDFAFVLDGVIGIMEQEIASMNNILPGARKSIPYVSENTVIFFWKMIELNKKFRAYVLDSERAMDLIAYLLCYNLEIKDKPQQHGLCRALSYIMQTLSAEPTFGLKLSSPIKANIPAKWAVPGSAADFLICSIYSIVATTSGALNSLYPAFIIALSNCAPYLKNLGVTSSTRLVQLFTSFSNPSFLLSDEGHPRLLFFMLEVFNGVVLHNLAENPHLIYGIITSHKTFEDLGTFTLHRGLREIKRVQAAKEEQAKKKQDEKSRPSSDRDHEEPREEKKRLLSHEVDLEANLEGAGAGAENSGHRRGPSDPEVQPVVPPTPSSESIPGAGSVSERARGKMKERRSSSLDGDGSLERIAAAGIGRNGFVPTREWVSSWQQGLPLDTVMLLISELLPKIEDMQAGRHKTNAVATIHDFLSSVTLKDVLPPAPPLVPRKFVWSDASIVWLTSLIWGEIFVRGMTPLGIWNLTNIRLFYVKQRRENGQRQISETVSNVVGGFLGRTNSTDGSLSRTRT